MSPTPTTLASTQASLLLEVTIKDMVGHKIIRPILNPNKSAKLRTKVKYPFYDQIANEICSGKFLHNVDTMSYVMGAPNADTFKVPFLIVNPSNLNYIQCSVSLIRETEH